MEITPTNLSQADRYKILIGGIVPRPIAFVSSRSPYGALNLAPFSFFAGVGSSPLTLLFCPANGPKGEEKDTLRNVKPVAEGGTGEFVVNLASEPYIRRVVACAEPLPYGQSEFDLSGLTPAPSAVVAPPRVAESPLCFECRTRQVIRLAPGEPGGGNIVIGDIVHVFAHDDVINERYHIDPAKIAAVGRMGGTGYASTRDRFEIPLGRAALEGIDGIAPGPGMR